MINNCTHKTKPIMKHFFIAMLLLGCSLSVTAQTRVIHPELRHQSAFAIFIDKPSFENTFDAVMAYKLMLEEDGLSAYILADNWTDPTHVQTELRKLHAQDPSLEGVVFIGDIPVAMIRQAQHMTTAFKMNEITFPRQQSSVASDRFYDDFDLEFEYVGQDEEKPLWHYYNLLPTSAQTLSSDIYSGRIMPLRNGTDPFQQINDYLYKVVADRKQQNQLDHLFSFFGSGYNSECMIAWASEKIALHQQFPYLGIPGHSLKFMSFNMGEEVKTHAMNELQREELDVALMHKHGSIDIQYLSKAMPLSNSRDMVNAIQNSIHYFRNTELTEEGLSQRLQWTGIPRSWYEQIELPEDFVPDNKGREAYELQVDEILEMTPGARFVMFDACYNGSFHHDENVAGAYIFNQGNTIATIGNTVNVLQDNWPNQFIGLLAEGVRLGHLRQHIQTLENHIVGDPTFRFSPRGTTDLNAFIVRNKNNPMAWEPFLSSGNADLVTFALTMMSKANPAGFSDLLFDMYSNSPLYTVRMECLNLLRNYNDHNYHKALKMAVSDSYELIRRLGGAWMEDVGHPDFVPYLVSMAINDPVYIRASGYVARKALNIYPREWVIPELNRQLDDAENMFGREELRNKLTRELNGNWAYSDEQYLALFDDDIDKEKKNNAIRSLRNNNYYHHLADYIDFARNKQKEESFRILMIEALGWFTHAYNKDVIINACREIAADKENPDSVRMEAEKTVRRLLEA
jgi:hypothetical protein